jgi:hypothetical protein
MTEVSPRLTPKESLPDTNGWKGRHLRAARVQPVAVMISALDQYAAKHEDRYESKIGEDYVLGPAFLDALRGVRTLLNGEIGGLDGGTCDAAILGIFSDAGFKGEL